MQIEKLTSRTPAVFTVLVILLVVSRIAVWFIESYKMPEPKGIKWQAPSRVDLAGVRDYQPKMVLYYFSEENSDACRKLDHGTLLNRNLVAVVNDNFLSVKVLNTNAEFSKELQQKFGVVMCPAFVVTLSNGKEVGSQTGYFGVSAKNLLSFFDYCKQREKYTAGLDYLTQAQYEQAASAFQTWLQKANKTNSQALDGSLYCALADLMLFKENAARQILETIRNGRYEDNSNWPQPLVRFMLSESSAQDLLEMCNHQENAQAQSLYIIGMLELRNGNVQNAVNDFNQVARLNEVSPEIRNLIAGQINIISKRTN